jgi:hypothetical protein
VAWESTVALVKDAEAWVALAEREAQESMSRVDAESNGDGLCSWG